MSFFQSLLCLFCFQAVAMATPPTHVGYSIEESSEPNTLMIRMHSVPPQGGTLFLNDGIRSKIINMMGDGKTIIESSEGSWSIPEGVQDLRWLIHLKEGKKEWPASNKVQHLIGRFFCRKAHPFHALKNSRDLEMLQSQYPLEQFILNQISHKA